jgi:hypothetical protein
MFINSVGMIGLVPLTQEGENTIMDITTTDDRTVITLDGAERGMFLNIIDRYWWGKYGHKADEAEFARKLWWDLKAIQPEVPKG